MTGAALLLLAASGAASSPVELPPVDLSVVRLSARLEQLDGRDVRVRGWLACGDRGCALRARPHGGRDVVAIGVAANDAMAPSLSDAAGHEVVIEGRATAACRHEVCTDAAPALMPARIVRIFGAPGATAKDR